jgi:hypothetical protein
MRRQSDIISRYRLEKGPERLTECPPSDLNFDFGFPGLGFGLFPSFFFLIKLGNKFGIADFGITKHDGVAQEIDAGWAHACEVRHSLN